jgi:hypothetical protein
MLGAGGGRKGAWGTHGGMEGEKDMMGVDGGDGSKWRLRLFGMTPLFEGGDNSWPLVLHSVRQAVEEVTIFLESSQAKGMCRSSLWMRRRVDSYRMTTT